MKRKIKLINSFLKYGKKIAGRIALILPVLFSLTAQAQEFELNKRTIQAYNSILSLRIEEGKKLLAQERKENPSNLMPYFIENYSDFLTLMMKDEPEEVYKQLEPNKDKRLEKIKTGPSDSPYYRYAQANIYLQWAFIKFNYEEYVSAFWDLRKAFSLLEENEKEFPAFLPNKTGLGLMNILVGSVPDSYKWATNIIGMSGSTEQGMKYLKEVLNSENSNIVFKKEAFYLYLFGLLYFEDDAEKAWQMVSDSKNNSQTDLLFNFIAAYMAMHVDKNDEAIKILEQKPSGTEYLPFPYLHFMLGLAKLHRLDHDADVHFLRFLKEYKKAEYLKETYQLLAWHALVHGKKDQYNHYIGKVKTEGAAETNEAKRAVEEAEQGIPDISLLKARLLFDGGYYKQALNQLVGKSADDYDTDKEKLEFTYRAARIYHELEEYDRALSFYKSTINRGKGTTYYYAANAAVQSGEIYAKKGNKEKAKEYYEMVLGMSGFEYEDYMKHKAKQGLKKLKNS